MAIFWNWFARYYHTSDDSQKQRQSLFLSVFLLMALVIVLVLTVINVFDWIYQTSGDPVLNLVEDLFTAGLLAGLLFLNRSGFVRLGAYLFVIFLVIAVPFFLPVEWQPYSLLIYVIPIEAASFIISPRASFLAVGLALLTFLLFQTNYFQSDLGMPVLFLSVLGFLAIVAWFVSERLEQALFVSHQSEKRYRSILEKNPYCMYLTAGSQAGRWLYVSPQIADLLGVPAAAWLEGSQLWSQKIHPEDRQAVMAEIVRCVTHSVPFQAEYRMLHTSGQVVWVSDYAIQAATPDQPDCIQGVLLDVTARKRAEQVQAATYRISQAAFTTDNLSELYASIHGVLGELMHAENFFIALHDPETDRFEFPYFVDQYDDPPKSVAGRRSLTEYVLRTGQPLFATSELCDRLAAQGEISTVGTPSVDWLGVPLKINNLTIGVMVIQSYTQGIRYTQAELDILTFVSTQVAMAVERKRNEAALREVNQLTSEVITGVNTGIIVYDRGERHLIWNHYMEQMTGLQKEQVVGRLAAEVFPLFHQPDLVELMAQALAGATIAIPDMEFSVPLTAKAGWLGGYCGPHRNAQGDIIGVIAVLNEITARKYAEDALRSALREKEVLLREIHHRVKNNLQVMSSLISLQAHMVQGEAIEVYFQEMQSRVRSMALVHEGLYQSQDLSRVNFAEYIEKLTADLMHSFAINPLIGLDLDVEDIYLGVDTAIPCGLIINELVTNALKHAFPGERAGNINIYLHKTVEGIYCLKVSDNGIGLPAGIDIYNTETLGMQLITILTRQIRGDLKVGLSGGACFEIEFQELKAPSRVY